MGHPLATVARGEYPIVKFRVRIVNRPRLTRKTSKKRKKGYGNTKHGNPKYKSEGGKIKESQNSGCADCENTGFIKRQRNGAKGRGSRGDGGVQTQAAGSKSRGSGGD